MSAEPPRISDDDLFELGRELAAKPLGMDFSDLPVHPSGRLPECHDQVHVATHLGHVMLHAKGDAILSFVPLSPDQALKVIVTLGVAVRRALDDLGWALGVSEEHMLDTIEAMAPPYDD